MLTGYLGIGFLAGLFLFVGKFIIYNMIMSAFPPGLKRWVYNQPLVMIAIDFGFGGLAAPVAGMAGGTIAMLTMITFGTLSASYVGYRVLLSKSKKWFNNLFDKYEPSRSNMNKTRLSYH